MKMVNSQQFWWKGSETYEIAKCPVTAGISSDCPSLSCALCPSDKPGSGKVSSLLSPYAHLTRFLHTTFAAVTYY